MLKNNALIALEDGTLFHGKAIGAGEHCTGELVFNTAMTGYQEILTDPSYAEQIITFTYPHIGNVGVNADDEESDHIFAKGLVIRDLPLLESNWRSLASLQDYLGKHNILGIAEIDTRALTQHLREHGAQRVCITRNIEHPEDAITIARNTLSLDGLDLAKDVSCKKPYQWTQGSIDIMMPPKKDNAQAEQHVVVYDFGVKRNILRLLVDQGCRLTVVPAKTPMSDVMALNPDGVLLSNGPGDPGACDYAIKAASELLQHNIPVLGICLGFQILALACGAKTYKMKFGHHGANHPVKDINTDQVFITSQNHGFAVDQTALPSCLITTHVSLFDGTLQGIKHRTKPMIAFQGHPEASPGPHDLLHLFSDFVSMMTEKTIATVDSASTGVL